MRAAIGKGANDARAGPVDVEEIPPKGLKILVEPWGIEPQTSTMPFLGSDVTSSAITRKHYVYSVH